MCCVSSLRWGWANYVCYSWPQESSSLVTKPYTIFAQSDATATIYFIVQFCAASIQERLLIQSGVYLTQCSQ